jgi:HicB family.
METRVVRQPTAFRLNKELLSRLKEEAKKANRSLNNYVECILMDSIYNEPNEETIEAIKEAQTGKYAGVLDMTNFDSFMKSIDDIE